ncbi:MAG: VTT domain-containing protein [bacterium]|nr:VTT domain-containing protein [bacterium]
MNLKYTLQSFISNRKISWKTDVLWLIVILLIILVFIYFDSVFPSAEKIEAWTARFGAAGPLVIIGIIILETVIAPIPGTIVPIVIGALYGIWPGLLYAWVGNIIGSIIAFWIARKLGRPVVKKIVSEEKIDKYDNYLQNRKVMIWVAYFIPLLPLDTISFVIGLSKIKFKFYLTVISIGMAGNLLLLTLFGERLISATGWEKALWIFVTIVFLAAAIVIERISNKKK